VDRVAVAFRDGFRGCSGEEPRVARWLSHDRVQSAVTGACLLTSRRLFIEQGGFEEQLPVVFNDLDYCLRLRRSGHASAVAAAAVLTHHEGRSRAGIEESADHAFFLARWSAELPAIDACSHPALAHDRDDWLADLHAIPDFNTRISMNTDPRPTLFDTDLQWQRWGEQEPYYGVITQEMFRRDKLNDEALQLFFNSGRAHARHVLKLCRHYFGADFVPRRVLDFGCGVGRLLIGFSEWAEQVVGVDISEAMLAEARKNCDAHGLKNIVLVRSDDQLSQVEGEFDLVHSTIVLQHINPQRGRDIFARLIERVCPGGVGSVHLTYAKAYLPDSLGQPPTVAAAVAPEPPPVVAAASSATTASDDAANARKRWRLPFFQAPAAMATPAPAAPPSPIAEPAPAEVPEAEPGLEMQMNVYPLNEIFYLVQTSGIREMHVEFSDHGGELGVVLFFRRPPA
jgi:SAM-dependent methyltransferase